MAVWTDEEEGRTMEARATHSDWRLMRTLPSTQPLQESVAEVRAQARRTERALALSCQQAGDKYLEGCCLDEAREGRSSSGSFPSVKATDPLGGRVGSVSRRTELLTLVKKWK